MLFSGSEVRVSRLCAPMSAAWDAVGITIKFILKLRYTLRLVSIPLDKPALMLRDNMSVVSVVLNATVLSSVLRKKHLDIGCHRVREAVAANVLRFAHVRSEDKLSDVLTKALPNLAFHTLLKPIPFKVPAHVRTEHDA